MSAPAPPPRKGRSGEHPALAEANRRIDDNAKVLLPELEAAVSRLARAADAATEPPPPNDSPTRGDWAIVIRGSGPHHNGDARDVERLATAFLSSLRSAGHAVAGTAASFDDGTVEDVASPPDTLRTTVPGKEQP